MNVTDATQCFIRIYWEIFINGLCANLDYTCDPLQIDFFPHNLCYLWFAYLIMRLLSFCKAHNLLQFLLSNK
ncbi:hypothetical protein AF47_02058 [Klebsiella aerogenes MGH 61]|nr:hypothetical protein AF47_02058 [Klebsiella aerogenes MGH 61]